MRKLLLGLMYALCMFVSPALAADIDYNNIKLMLPLDKNGGTTGTAVEVYDLKNYEKKPWFYKENDLQIFALKTDMATSSGSKYPRTEAQEIKDGRRYVFTSKTGGLIQSQLAVLELPTDIRKGKSCVVFEQFHGKSNELMRKYYCAPGYISYKNDKSGSKEKEIEYYLKDKDGNKAFVPLGEFFESRSQVKGNKLTVSVTYKGVEYSHSETLSKYFLKDTFFAKFGAYGQVSGKLNSGAGNLGFGWTRVGFLKADISHPE